MLRERCLRREPVHLVRGWEGDRPLLCPDSRPEQRSGSSALPSPLLFWDTSVLPLAHPSQQFPLCPRPNHGPHSPMVVGWPRPLSFKLSQVTWGSWRSALSTIPRCPSHSQGRVPDLSTLTLEAR